MAKPSIALQLYSVRDETKTDFARTVNEVAQFGFAGVEMAGYGNLDVHEANRALRDAGLAVCGTHVSREELRQDFNRVVDEALLLGTTEIVCPYWPPEEFTSVSAVEQIGLELDALGARLRERGLLLSFHNHKAEFRRIEGRPIISWMMDAAAPRNLGIELDVYWAQLSGCPPERFLYEHGHRIRLLHLKDEKILGDGPVDFEPIFDAADKVDGVDWHIVEQEIFDDAPLPSVKRCLDRLNEKLAARNRG